MYNGLDQILFFSQNVRWWIHESTSLHCQVITKWSQWVIAKPLVHAINMSQWVQGIRLFFPDTWASGELDVWFDFDGLSSLGHDGTQQMSAGDPGAEIFIAVMAQLNDDRGRLVEEWIVNGDKWWFSEMTRGSFYLLGLKLSYIKFPQRWLGP